MKNVRRAGRVMCWVTAVALAALTTGAALVAHGRAEPSGASARWAMLMLATAAAAAPWWTLAARMAMRVQRRRARI